MPQRRAQVVKAFKKPCVRWLDLEALRRASPGVGSEAWGDFGGHAPTFLYARIASLYLPSSTRAAP